VRIVLVGTGVHPIPPTGYGGVERTIGELGQALTKAGEQVRLVNQVRKERSLDEYWFALGVRRALSEAPYDVVHASTPVVANQLRFHGIPYVYTTHSRHWFDRHGLREHWGARLERRAVRGAAHTIALTQRLAHRIREEVGPSVDGRMSVIPIGVDAQRFRPDPERRTGQRALGVGVVAPVKRWELAARALQGTGWSLRIAGPLPDRAYADRVLAEGNHVELLGEVGEETLERLYAESDLLVHPSRVELLAGTVLQGLAAGLPVLGADPISDVVLDGRTGFVAPIRAAPEEIVRFLREQATRLRNDENARRRLGEAARLDAETRFAWPTIARQHQELYRTVADATPLTRR
jgi:glycosyltransferase involved in cell wall biosynthesis